jgi:hypothetical protein
MKVTPEQRERAAKAARDFDTEKDEMARLAGELVTPENLLRRQLRVLARECRRILQDAEREEWMKTDRLQPLRHILEEAESACEEKS